MCRSTVHATLQVTVSLPTRRDAEERMWTLCIYRFSVWGEWTPPKIKQMHIPVLI